MSDCVIGLCFVRDQHVNPLPPDHDRDCWGCRPSRAEYGTLCARHRGRMARALIQAPDLVGHIRTELEPSGSTPDGQPRGHRAPPAPIRLNAVDDADLVYAGVAQLAEAVADVLDLTGPEQPGAWRDHLGRVLGVTPEHAVEATTLASRWLHVRLDWLSAWDGIPEVFANPDPEFDFLGGAIRVIEATSARWPTASKARYIPGVVCPDCDRRGSLVYHPPSWATTTYAYAYDSKGRPHGKLPRTEGDDVVIQCGNLACGYIVPDDHVGWYARLVADIAPGQEPARAG